MRWYPALLKLMSWILVVGAAWYHWHGEHAHAAAECGLAILFTLWSKEEKVR